MLSVFKQNLDPKLGLMLFGVFNMQDNLLVVVPCEESIEIKDLASENRQITIDSDHFENA